MWSVLQHRKLTVVPRILQFLSNQPHLSAVQNNQNRLNSETVETLVSEFGRSSAVIVNIPLLPLSGCPLLGGPLESIFQIPCTRRCQIINTLRTRVQMHITYILLWLGECHRRTNVLNWLTC